MVISFFVSVPVLSERITVVAPNVSTEESCFIIAFLFARRWTPRASAIVIVAGRPSGTAATATEIVKRRLSMKVFPWSANPMMKRMAEMASVTIAMITPIRFNSFWRGEASCLVSAVSRVIFPNSVFSPVAITIALPDP